MKKQSNKSHWCRIVMNNATQNIIASLAVTELEALEVSGQAWKSTPFKTYTTVSYPQFDICNVDAEHNQSVDIVIAEQVFEHVKNPFKGVTNVYNMLRPNGYFLITTPFFLKVHGAPMDYWRWTSDGLKTMLEDCGFFVEISDSWGNKDCVVGSLTEWKTYEDGLNLDNEPDFPVVCWALAKKLPKE
jgi:SAM-dependent methyltransferase